MKKTLNYSKQWIDDSDIHEVVEVLKSDFITQGPKIEVFERKISEYVDSKYCVVVSSGTAALHIAVMALDIRCGSKGITSPITFAATSNCLIYNGLEPNFADIDENTYCISPRELERKIDNQTKVILPVHFAGQPAEMEKIHKMTHASHINIIEDASHAFGSRYQNGLMVGSCCYSRMTIFSFHPVKTLTTGEGGAITTNSQELYEKLRTLREHGIVKDHKRFMNQGGKKPYPWYYEMQELGFNYRMTEIQAALGISQLKKINDFIERRREIVNAYNQAFENIEWIVTPFEREEVFSAFHLYVIQIDFKKIGKSRAQIVSQLKKRGINTQVHYIPVHLMPYYTKNHKFKLGDYPKAERYYDQCLSIPLYPKMSDDDAKRVSENILQLCAP